MQHAILNLSSPAVMSTLLDMVLMQRWELLRRSQAGLSTAQLATEWQVPAAEAQRSIDRLLDAGFIVRTKMTAQHRTVSYRAVSQEVLVAWDRASPAQNEFVARNRLRFRELSRSIVDRHDGEAALGDAEKPGIYLYASVLLTREEIDKMNWAIRSVIEILDTADRRAEVRAAQKFAEPRADAGLDGAAQKLNEASAPELPYHLSVEFRGLRHPEPPIPHYGLWDNESIPKELAYAARIPSAVLTTKELDVARRLAAGESRPAIAKALRLSVNTIASTTKRVYAKLGVHNRSELTVRMKSG
jgi:DNA-binding NarL/FixJ family response regulator